jgi:type II secretory pathway pseudopilin PulG
LAGARKHAYSLIEIALALGILVVVLLTAMSFLGTSMTLQRTSAETELARSALERRAAGFRSLLHSAPLDTDANRTTQFQLVLDTIGTGGLDGNGTTTPVKIYDFDLVEGAPKLSGNPNQAQISVWAFTKDYEAETVCGLTALDLDGDQMTFFPAAIGDTATPVADLQILPLKLDIVWVPAGADAGTSTKTLTLVTVLY